MMAIFFHIGLPRTGTTSLQWHIFSNTEYFEPFGFNFNKIHPKHKNTFLRNYGLGSPENYQKDPDLTDVRKQISAIHEKACKTNKLLLYSDEKITGAYTRVVDQVFHAELINSIADSPKIIMTIRKQDDFLVSRYRQLKPVKIWTTLGLPDINNAGRTFPVLPEMKKMISFDTWLDYGLDTYYQHSFSNLCYYKLYKTYATVLGPENVYVLLYENLKNNPRRFAESFAEVLGLDVEWTLSQLIRPHRNRSSDNLKKRIFKSARHDGLGTLNTMKLFYDSIFQKGGFKPSITEKQLIKLKTVYGPDNAALDKELNLGLADHGYFMP